MTLYETIKRNSIERPDEAAYTYFRYRRTHAQMFADVNRTADALVRLGIGEGDRVAIALPNSPKLLNLLYAANKIGAVAVLLNPKSPAQEMTRQIRMTRCKALFFSSIAYTAVLNLGKDLASLKVVAVSVLEHLPFPIQLALIHRQYLGKPGMNAIHKAYAGRSLDYAEFIADGRDSMAEEIAPDENREAVIIFSGGTNGTFKAVVHSSAGLYYSAVHCLKTEEPLPEHVSMLAILPAFHIFGLSVAIHLPLVAGGCIVLVPVFNLGIVTSIIKRECPTFFPGVPTIFERLLQNKRFARLAAKGRLNFKEFRHGFVGGDHLSDVTRDAFNEVIRRCGGEGYISMGYGMSECCPICVNHRTSAEEECIGLTFDTTDVRIRSEEGFLVQDGQLGELEISSSYMMLYGFDEEGNRNEPYPEATADPVTGVAETKRWLPTGDIGYLRDGKVFYRCRERRIIKVSGNTIFADSIERVIEENVPTVKKAYVVPVPHATRGHIAYAFLETKGEMHDDALLEVVQRTCKDKMISYAIPAGILQVTEAEIPRTAIGKIAWGLLEQRAVQKMNMKK